MYLSKNIEPFLGHIDMDDFQYISSDFNLMFH